MPSAMYGIDLFCQLGLGYSSDPCRRLGFNALGSSDTTVALWAVCTRSRVDVGVPSNNKWRGIRLISTSTCIVSCERVRVCVCVMCAHTRVYVYVNARWYAYVCPYISLTLPQYTLHTQWTITHWLWHIVTFFVGHYCLKFHNFTKKKRYVIPN